MLRKATMKKSVDIGDIVPESMESNIFDILDQAAH